VLSVGGFGRDRDVRGPELFDEVAFVTAPLLAEP
jgi:hypothetical protein